VKLKDLRLLLSVGSSRKLFIGAALAALINTAIVITNGFLIATVITGLISHDDNIEKSISFLALLWGVRAIYISQFDRWASIEASRLKASLRSKILDSSQILIATPSTHLSTLLIKGANSLDIYLARFLPQIFSASLTPLVVIIVLAFLDPLSALIAALTLPLIPIFGALIGRFTQDSVEAKWRTLGTLGKYFEDSLRGIHTLAIFSRVKGQEERIKKMGDSYTDETMKVLRISFLSALVLELAATISVALIAVSIGLRLVSGSMEFFPALAILVLAPEVYFPLRNAASLFHASADGGEALAQLTRIHESSNPEEVKGGAKVATINEITWKDWRSPFGAGQLESCTLATGDVLVIRGGSGLGKTTFLTSLLGFGKSAQYSINQEDARNCDINSLRKSIGWIPQSPALISGTLRELFQRLDDSVTDEVITKMLTEVGLSLEALPHGLNTEIGGLGEKSGTLSGGQMRRIAIARALFISPSLIIADEPTADLDPVSAGEILKVLAERARKGAIVIAVLHAPDHHIDGAHEVVMVQR
jgi:ABC-type transport system involved in cytochrome bd biosynthesis fused ATPase/permease subunit